MSQWGSDTLCGLIYRMIDRLIIQWFGILVIRTFLIYLMGQIISVKVIQLELIHWWIVHCGLIHWWTESMIDVWTKECKIYKSADFIVNPDDISLGLILVL